MFATLELVLLLGVVELLVAPDVVVAALGEAEELAAVWSLLATLELLLLLGADDDWL